MTKTKKQIVWKAEDVIDGVEVGPVTLIDLDGRDADPNITLITSRVDGSTHYSMPFGYQPAWQTDGGWITHAEAQAMAHISGVDLVTS